MDGRIAKIRENERKSHIAIYNQEELYHTDSWLSRPVKTVRELLPYFENKLEVHILDLGCGVGRNAIAIAQAYRRNGCSIDCVDLLDTAIEKLTENAKIYGVSSEIRGAVQSIEDYTILPEHYDWILAVSALEHVASENVFVQKMQEIRQGIRENGIVCLIINSNAYEVDVETGCKREAQFEVILETKQLLDMLHSIFCGWKPLKETISRQQYEIPRENGISRLCTNVVTFVARKTL